MSKQFRVTVESNLRDLGADTHRLLKQVVSEGVFEIEGHAKVLIQTGPKTGRIYRRKGRKHRASAPGEAPATDTGNLVNSITSTVEIGDTIRGEVSVGAAYAAVLEFGGARVAARPFLGPAVDIVAPSFRKAVIAVVKRASERAGQ